MKKLDIGMAEERNDCFLLAKNLYNAGLRPTLIYGVTRGGNYVAGPVSEYFKWKYSKDKLDLKLITGSVVAHEYSYENRPGEVIIEGWAPELSKVTENDTVLICDDCFDTGNTLKTLIQDIELNTPLKKQTSPIMLIGNDKQFEQRMEVCKNHTYPSPLEVRAKEISMLPLIQYIRMRCPDEIFDPKYGYFLERKLVVVTHDLKQFLGEHKDESFLRLFPDAAVNIFWCRGKWEDKNGPWIQYNRYEMMGLTDEEIEERYGVKL